MKHSNKRRCIKLAVISILATLCIHIIPVTAFAQSIEISGQYASVELPESNIIGSPIVITNAKNTPDNTKNLAASIIIFELSSDLSVPGHGNIEQAIKCLDLKKIPAFRVEDKETAVALAKELKRLNYSDAYIISSSAEALKAARTENSAIYSALDYSDNWKLPATDDVRNEVNESLSRVVILSEKMATREVIDELQSYLLFVWTYASGESDSDLVSSILTGANGIITSTPDALCNCFTAYFDTNSIVRKLQLISHRGKAPGFTENSIAGSVYSFSMGVAMIENDIHLTKDGVIVVMHNDTIDSTSSGSGAIRDMTYEQLSQYHLDKAGVKQPIPTLEDYFRTFKGLNVNLVVEIKSGEPELIEKLVALINKYDISKQINVISFNPNQISILKSTFPEISCGYLAIPDCSALSDIDMLKSLLPTLQSLNATCNPSYSYVTPSQVQALNLRGISVNVWTADTDQKFFSLTKLLGASSVTSDACNTLSGIYENMYTLLPKYSFKAGESTNIDLRCINYKGSAVPISSSELIIIEGNQTITYSNGVISATEPGSATVMIKTSFDRGASFSIYTSPFTVNVSENTNISTETETDTEIPTYVDTTPESEPGTTANNSTNNGCNSTLISPVLTIIAAIPFVLKRKKEH